MSIKITDKDVKYLNKDFSTFRKALIDFSKSYFPDTYNDFSPTSPGMMFVEMAAYVGDVLSYYIDNQYKEMLLLKAEERKNILLLAQAFGYRPKTTKVSSVDLDVYLTVPNIGSGEDNEPDYSQAPIILAGMTVQSSENPDIIFRTEEPIVFNWAAADDAQDVPDASIYEYNDGEPTVWLLKKTATVYSCQEYIETFRMPSTPKSYHKILLSKDNIVEIVNVEDSNGNIWYETPYLAQSQIFTDDDTNDFPGTDKTPYTLSYGIQSKRFITRITEDNKVELQFGAGGLYEEDTTLNSADIGKLLPGGILGMTSIDSSNWALTHAYGEIPSTNMTLTVTYTYGGGVESNVASNDLTTIVGSSFQDTFEWEDSLAVNNVEAAIGGGSGETVEEIRQNTLAYFGAQDRCVTVNDYIVRAYSMPSKYGVIAKAFAKQTEAGEVGLYVLSFDRDGYLTTININPGQPEDDHTCIKNLRIYLSKFIPIGTTVNIENAHIANFTVNFKIKTKKNYNKNAVLLKCIDGIKKHFEIDRWQINQPIIESEIYQIIMETDGVLGIIMPQHNDNNDYLIISTDDTWDHTEWSEDTLDGFWQDGIILPATDPTIFELRDPDNDIKGTVV